MRYHCDDGSFDAEVEAASPREAAQRYINDGHWETDPEETFWIQVCVWTDVSEDWITVAVHPPEPPCSCGEAHDWQQPYKVVGGCVENPGVFSRGGAGLVKHYVCQLCGVERIENTGAQHPRTGEEGLESIRYVQIPGWGV